MYHLKEERNSRSLAELTKASSKHGRYGFEECLIFLKCSTFRTYVSKHVPWDTDLNKKIPLFQPFLSPKDEKKGYETRVLCLCMNGGKKSKKTRHITSNCVGAKREAIVGILLLLYCFHISQQKRKNIQVSAPFSIWK